MKKIFGGFNLWITGIIILIVWGIGRIVLQVLVNNGNLMYGFLRIWNMVGIVIVGVILLFVSLVLLLIGILR